MGFTHLSFLHKHLRPTGQLYLHVHAYGLLVSSRDLQLILHLNHSVSSIYYFHCAQVLILFHKHSTRIPSKCVVRSGKKLLDTRNRIFSCYCTGNTDAGRTTESNQLLVHQRLLQLVVNANHGPFLMQESDSFSTIRTPHLLHAIQNKEKYRKLYYKVF